MTHTGQALPNGADGELDCKVYSADGPCLYHLLA